MTSYLGIDLGGTTIKYALVDELGQVSQLQKRETPKTTEEIKQVFSEIVFPYADSISGVGISAPGIIQKNGEMTTAGGILDLYGENLKTYLEEKFSLPVVITNDGNCAAVAERWVGNAINCDNYLCIVLGTGLGAGLILNGKLLPGFNGVAGEFGWSLMGDYKKFSDIEESSMNFRGAVVLGLLRKYNLMNQKEHTEEIIEDPRVIYQRRTEGEKAASEALQEFYEDLATMLLNLCVCIDPEKILIGGGISENDLFMKELKDSFNQLMAQHQSIKRIKDKIHWQIEPTKLGNQAGLIGAVYQLKEMLADN